MTFSLTGTDANLFAVDAAGVITFVGAPGFEDAGDTDADNVFDLTVTATDPDGLSSSQAVAVTVTDVNEAPVITSVAAVSVAENQLAASSATATDADGDTLTFSLTGADANLFAVDAAGVITFIGAPDFEMPGSMDGDNVFDLTVTATDPDGLSSSQAVAVTVTDVNEAPVITSAAAVSVAENQIAVSTATATDVDGDALTLTLTGTDAALFAIDAAGVITFVSAPDFETPGSMDGDNVFDLIVNANDGTVTTTQALTITVTDALDPVIGLNGIDDILNGGPEANILDGLTGSDTLSGLGGDDTLISDGDDILLDGGAGIDTADFSGVTSLDTTGAPLFSANTVNPVTGMTEFSADFFSIIDLDSGDTLLVTPATVASNNIVGNIANIENVIGTDFPDLIIGDVFDNTFDGGLGNDILVGNEGNDILNGGDGNDQIVPGSGNDIVNAGSGDDLIFDAGNVSTAGTPLVSNDIIDGGAGNDTYVFADFQAADVSITNNGDGTLTVTGVLSGTDTLTNVEVIQLGDGTPLAIPGAPPVTPPGSSTMATAGNDTLTGTAGDDVIDGLAGNDTLDGGVGADTLIGSSGDDILISDGQDSLLDGGTGSDTLDFSGVTGVVTTGMPIIEFSLVDATTGITTFDEDFFVALDFQSDVAVIDFGAGGTLTNLVNSENIIGKDFADVILGNTANNTLSGGLGNDLIVSDTGNDILNGGDGNDAIIAGFGNDTLNGGSGNDIIIDGPGNDIIDGGIGIDTLVLEDTQLADVSVTNNGDGTLTVVGLINGTDTLTNVESIVLLDGTPVTTPNAPSVKTSAPNEGSDGLTDATDLSALLSDEGVDLGQNSALDLNAQDQSVAPDLGDSIIEDVSVSALESIEGVTVSEGGVASAAPSVDTADLTDVVNLEDVLTEDSLAADLLNLDMSDMVDMVG